jgi:hypothetical protein
MNAVLARQAVVLERRVRRQMPGPPPYYYGVAPFAFRCAPSEGWNG